MPDTKQKRYYKKRYANDESFREKEKERVKEYRRRRYNNNDENDTFRDTLRKRALDYYYKKKAEKLQLAESSKLTDDMQELSIL
eukprot:761752-Hanusia_phi.AAC.1